MSATFRLPTSAGPLLTLKHGRHELVLAPECGARIAARGATCLLRPVRDCIGPYAEFISA